LWRSVQWRLYPLTRAWDELCLSLVGALPLHFLLPATPYSSSTKRFRIHTAFPGVILERRAFDCRSQIWKMKRKKQIGGFQEKLEHFRCCYPDAACNTERAVQLDLSWTVLIVRHRSSDRAASSRGSASRTRVAPNDMGDRLDVFPSRPIIVEWG
jgi:hypothetical protein